MKKAALSAAIVALFSTASPLAGQDRIEGGFAEYEDPGAALMREDRETGFFWPEPANVDNEPDSRLLPLKRFGETRDAPATDGLRRWEPDEWRSAGDGLRRWPQRDSAVNKDAVDGISETP